MLFGLSFRSIFGLFCTVLVSVSCTEARPITQEDLQSAVFQHDVANICVQNGKVSEVQSMASYISRRARTLSQVSQEQVTSAREQVRIHYPQINVTWCNQIQLYAVQEDQTIKQRKQQSDELSQSIQAATDAWSTGPNYANCVTVGGVTNCYAY